MVNFKEKIILGRKKGVEGEKDKGGGQERRRRRKEKRREKRREKEHKSDDYAVVEGANLGPPSLREKRLEKRKGKVSGKESKLKGRERENGRKGRKGKER